MLRILAIFPVLSGLCAAIPASPDWGHGGPPHSWPSHSWPSPTWTIPQRTMLPTVTVASGVLVGTTISVAGATETVNQFLGVPFAASPPERFSPPQNPAAWEGQLDVSSRKDSCVQQFLYPAAARAFTIALFNTPAPPESEDCLYLNVFTPASECRERGGRAVMFWIYGGGLQFGYGGLSAYDGSSFAANQDVIVVTINYRTNVFGFSNSPQVPLGEQNSGFLDQRKALEWVQENIAAFGGDPSKVTIFGESAGGYSVKQLLALPPNPLTFSAAIMQSEATFSANGLAAWDALVTNVSCSNAASVVDCMRKIPAATLKSVIEQNELVFFPAVDDITESSNVATQIDAGTFAHVPFMIGTNSQEGRLFTIGDTNVTAFLEALLPGDTAVQQAIAAQYPESENGYFVTSDIDTNIAFFCPSLTLANLAASKGYNLHRYYYNASFPNSTPWPDAGAWHSSEIREVFGTYNRTEDTAQQIALSAAMQKIWADFAKYHRPGWPKYTGSNGIIGDLGGNGSDGEYDINGDVVDYKCPAYAPVIAALGI